MKCVKCGRMLFVVSHTFRGQPIGPVCFEKLSGSVVAEKVTKKQEKRGTKKQLSSRTKRNRKPSEEDQLDLFKDQPVLESS